MSGQGCTAVLDLPEPDAATLRALEAWLTRIRDEARPMPDVVPFIVTPLGMADHARLAARLKGLGTKVLERRRLVPWPRLATAVHNGRPSARHLRRAALHEAAWEALFPGAGAEAWVVARRDARRLEEAKAPLRAEWPSVAVRFNAGADSEASLHAFHLADEADALDEAARLEAAMRLFDGR